MLDYLLANPLLFLPRTLSTPLSYAENLWVSLSLSPPKSHPFRVNKGVIRSPYPVSPIKMVLFKTKFTFQKRVKLAQTLWLLSWVSVLVGCLTFGLGIFLKVQLWIHNEVMDNTMAHAVPNTVITAGLVGVLLGLFASKSSQDSLDMAKYPRWKSLMLPYFFFSILSCLLCFTALFLSIVMRGSLEESLKVGLRNGIRFYKDTDTPGRCYQKRTMDKLQMDFQCCGNNHYKDWFEVQWISNRYLDFSSKEVKE